jgi:hypothetical protein
MIDLFWNPSQRHWVLANETQNHKRGALPFSRLESRGLSEKAKALILYLETGEEEYKNFLIDHIKQSIPNIAQSEGWRSNLSYDLQGLSEAVFLEFTSKLTILKLCQLIGCSDKHYQCRWQPKIEQVQIRTLKPLIDEINELA